MLFSVLYMILKGTQTPESTSSSEIVLMDKPTKDVACSNEVRRPATEQDPAAGLAS